MVEKLTKKQEEAIIPYREKWIARILRTEQSDDEIKENIKGIYRMCELEEPKAVWIMDSMLGVQVALNVLRKSKELDLANIRNNIRANISANIWNNISDNIENNISDNIWNNIEANIWNNIRNNISDNIENNISDNIWNNIWNNISANIEANIRANISANIRNNIRNNIEANISDNIENNIEANIRAMELEWFGFSDNEASWLHWYLYQKYYFDHGLLPKDKYSELLSSYIEMSIDAWAVYYSKDIAIVSRKPNVRREDGRLHSDQLPAVSFKDGYELYYLDGVHFEKDLWEKVVSQTMSFKEIMAIEISDQRTVALKYNPEAVIKENAKLVHVDGRNNELYLIEGQELNEELEFPKIWFLKMKCPTGRTFIEGVPPEEAEKNPDATAMQALLCDLTPSEYQSMVLES